jgi:hypothetical protein
VDKLKTCNLLAAGIAVALAGTVAGVVAVDARGQSPGATASAGGVRAQNVDLAPRSSASPQTQAPKKVTIKIVMRAVFVGGVCVTNAAPKVCTGDLLEFQDYTLDANMPPDQTAALVQGFVRKGQIGVDRPDNENDISVSLNTSSPDPETHCVRLDGAYTSNPSDWSIKTC